MLIKIQTQPIKFKKHRTYNLKNSQGNFFHIYNRGVLKNIIFKNDFEKDMFLTSLFVCMFEGQLPYHVRIPEIAPYIHEKGFIDEYCRDHLSDRRKLISLLDFNILNNHFHMKAYGEIYGGISMYCKKVQLSLTHRFNYNYKTSGHVLQGPFQAKLIDTDSYHDVLTEYIRYNHAEIPKYSRKPENYKYSSLYDVEHGKRWDLLDQL